MVLQFSFHSLPQETSRRLLQFHVPRVIATSPHMRLIEDNPDRLSLGDIYRRRCSDRALDQDAPVKLYYERIATLQANGVPVQHRHLLEILEDVQKTLVPKTALKVSVGGVVVEDDDVPDDQQPLLAREHS